MFKKLKKSIKCSRVIEKMVGKEPYRNFIILECVLDSNYYECKDHRSFLLLGPCCKHIFQSESYGRITEFIINQINNPSERITLPFVEPLFEFFRVITPKVYMSLYPPNWENRTESLILLTEITKKISFDLDSVSRDICLKILNSFANGPERVQINSLSLFQCVISKTKDLYVLIYLASYICEEASKKKELETFYLKSLSLFPCIYEVSSIISSNLKSSVCDQNASYILDCYAKHFCASKCKELPKDVVSKCFDMNYISINQSSIIILELYYKILSIQDNSDLFITQLSLIISSRDINIRNNARTKLLLKLVVNFPEILDKLFGYFIIDVDTLNITDEKMDLLLVVISLAKTRNFSLLYFIENSDLFESILSAGVSSCSMEIRVNSLKIITESLKSVEAIKLQELNVLKRFIRLDSCQSVDLRQKIYHQIKHFLIRLKRVIYSDWREIQVCTRKLDFVENTESINVQISQARKRLDFKLEFIAWFYNINVISF
jgi:hypothetical protein